MRTIPATMQDLKDTEQKLENKLQVESDNRHQRDEDLTKQFFLLQETIDDKVSAIPKIYDLLNQMKLNQNTNDINTDNLEKKVDKHIDKEIITLDTINTKLDSFHESKISNKIFYRVIIPFAVGVVAFGIKVIADISAIKAVLKIANIE